MSNKSRRTRTSSHWCLICDSDSSTDVTDPTFGLLVPTNGLDTLRKLVDYPNIIGTFSRQKTRRTGAEATSRMRSETEWNNWTFILCNQCKAELEEIETVLVQLEELHQKVTRYQKRISTQIHSLISDKEEESKISDYKKGNVGAALAVHSQREELLEARRRILSELEAGSESPSAAEEADLPNQRPRRHPKIPEHRDGDGEPIEARPRLRSELEFRSQSQSLQPLDVGQDLSLSQDYPSPNSKRSLPVIRLHRIEQQFPSVFTNTITNVSGLQLSSKKTRTKTEKPADIDIDIDLDLIKDEPDSIADLSSADEQYESERSEDSTENVSRASTRKRKRSHVYFPYKCNAEGCSAGFSRSRLLTAHCVKAHPEMKIPVLRCPYADTDAGCYFISADPCAISKHVKTKHSQPSSDKHSSSEAGATSRVPKAFCKYPECGYICTTTTQLQLHVQMSHSVDNICGRCGILFADDQTETATAHEQAHVDENEAKAKLRALHQKQALPGLPAGTKTADIDKCPYCEKKFPPKARSCFITKHINTHTKPYKCDIEGCSAEFSGGQSLRAHLIKRHPEVKIPAYHCPYADSGCSYISAYKSTITIHVKKKHSLVTDKLSEHDHQEGSRETAEEDFERAEIPMTKGETGYHVPIVLCKYPECAFSCTSTAQLQLHVGMEHVVENICRRCGTIFPDGQPELVAAHEQAHTDEDEARAKLLPRRPVLPFLAGIKTTKLNKCPYCDKIFSSKARKYPSMIIRHIAVHTKPYKCGVDGCSAAFTTDRPLRAHCSKSHPDLKIPAFHCPYANSGCSYTSGYSNGIKKHIKNKHNPDRTKHPCPIPGCDFQAAMSGYLKAHVETVHEGKKNFLCTECGYKSYTKVQLTKHMRRHTGEKPFACTICGRTFALSSTLRAHERTHQSDRRPQHVCEQCGNAYFGIDKLKKHIRLKHNQEEDT